MEVYCGTDIIEVDRIKEAIKKNKSFKTNIFSETEIEYIEKNDSKIKYQRYAGRFAAKEAIYKALSKILIEENMSPSFLDVEILNDKDLRDRPYVNILGDSLNKIFVKYKMKIDLSISHIENSAIAMAVVSIDKE